MWLLLFPLIAFPAEWKLAWEVKTPGVPRAAFYSAAGDALYVSLEKNGAELLKISADGKPDPGFSARREGRPGPMRSFGDRLYWAVGKKVYSLPLAGGRLKEEGEAAFPVDDLALDRKGTIRVAGSGGVGELKSRAPSSPAVTGLFQWQDTLYALEEGKKLLAIPGGSRALCASDCRGLERAVDGGWITAEGKWVVKIGKGRKREALVKGSSRPGRIAYVYRRDSKDDLLVVPFPEERAIRAYKIP